MGVNYGLDKVRFPSPVRSARRSGSRPRSAEVEDVAGNGVQMLLDFTVEIDGAAKPACVARAVYRYYA